MIAAPATRTGRLFVALWPDAAAREGLVAWQRAVAWPERARPTPPRDLHLTLVFVGSLAGDRLGEVVEACAVEPGDAALQLDRFEVWRGGIAVLVPSAVPAALLDWQARIAAALRERGLPFDERPWRPHVTLARRGQGATLAAAPAPVHWHAKDHALAVRDGPHYRVLARNG